MVPLLDKYLYWFLFRIYRKVMRVTCDADVYPRGSLPLGYSKFLKSDIDVSVFTDSDTRACVRVHSAVRKVLPIFSEVNIYKRNEWIRLSRYLNCCERKRLDFLNFPVADVENNVSLWPEQLVFLIRMILANRSHLTDGSVLREEKWRAYFEIAGCQQVSIPSRSSLEDSFVAEVLRHLGPGDYGGIFSSLLSDAPKPAWVDPVEWISLQLRGQKPLNPPQMTAPESKVFRAGLLWEVCGLYSQIDQISCPENILNHIGNLKKCLSTLSGTNREVAAFKTLEEIVKARLRSNRVSGHNLDTER